MYVTNPKLLARLLRMAEVSTVVGMSEDSIRRAIRRGAFPAPVRIGLRAIAFREQDIAAWLAAAKPACRPNNPLERQP